MVYNNEYTFEDINNLEGVLERMGSCVHCRDSWDPVDFIAVSSIIQQMRTMKPLVFRDNGVGDAKNNK